MQERTAVVVDVVNAVRRITRGLRVAAVNTQAAAGISAAQLFVLGFLADGEPHSIKGLAALTMTDRSSVAAVVDRLVARGLAERTWSALDRRRAEVRITSAGLYLLDAAPAAPTALLLSALDKLPDAALGELSASLGALVGALDLEATPAPMLFEEEASRRGGPVPAPRQRRDDHFLDATPSPRAIPRNGGSGMSADA